MALTDARSEEVDPRAECEAPDSPTTLMTSDRVADGGTHADEIHGGHDPVVDADTGAAEPWARRALEGAVAAAVADAARAIGGHVSRGTLAVARRKAPRCIVCGREGGRILPRPHQRAGRWTLFAVLRCRDP